jgi:ribosomal protein S18 acetylase RimI-like enzyme
MSSSQTSGAGLELVRAESQHVGEIGRICYEAFKNLHDRHHFPLDLPSAALARQVLGMMVSRSDFYSVVALLDGQVVGSNFLSLSDPVAGIGPVTVEPCHQGKDIGLALMQDVVDQGRCRGIERIRLLQETINVGSLSLYASMGFDSREEVAYLQATATPAEDPNVRPVIEQDLPAVEQLSANIYQGSRRNEVAAAIRYGFSPLLRQRNGRVTGYLIPGLFGHGVAESEDDACALVGEMARRLPPEAARFFCPVRQANFFRRVLKMGCRTIKVWTLMTLGPYKPPREVWMPSVLY